MGSFKWFSGIFAVKTSNRRSTCASVDLFIIPLFQILDRLRQSSWGYIFCFGSFIRTAVFNHGLDFTFVCSTLLGLLDDLSQYQRLLMV
jgi:hypothetical protein